MSKRAHIRRRRDSDDEDDDQPVADDSNEHNSNDGSNSTYENICFFALSIRIVFL